MTPPVGEGTKTGRTLNEVLERINFIGHAFYRGKHYDNMKNIWDELEEEEKNVVLLSLYHMYVVNNGGVHAPPPGLTATPNSAPKETSQISQLPALGANETLEEYDQRLMVRTKHFISIALVLVSVLFIFLLAGSVVAMDFETTSDIKLDFLVKIFKVFVDGK